MHGGREVFLKQLEENVAPGFLELSESLAFNRHTHYFLKGGRGSGKSSFIALALILGMMMDEKANGVALRKVGTALRDSVHAQLLWAIDQLEVSQHWHSKVVPMELIYKPTGQKILFRGADNPDKIKSTKFEKGYCKFIWFEEADQFQGMDEIGKINQSLLRGGENFKVFYSYNPPESSQSFINSEALIKREDRFIHHSDYRSVPRKWLGEQFFVEAEHLAKVNYRKYLNQYLGQVTGSIGEVFGNLTIRVIELEEKESFDQIRCGLDFGYAADPLHYCACHFDLMRKRLFIFGEIHEVGMKLSLLAEEILMQKNGRAMIVADCAEPRSIAVLKEYGLNISGAKKGPDSVYFGIKYLQDMEEIIIDPIKCPHTVREFSTYEMVKDKNGNFTREFSHKENHSIDAVRYALESYMRQSRAKVSDIRQYHIW